MTLSAPSGLILSDPLWERVVITDGCWPWTGAHTPTGYGRLRRDGKFAYAHRLVAEMVYGPIPTGMYACHHCDNPPCCRPDHLFIGTPSDNVRDRDAKGRHWVHVGEASPGAILKRDEVAEIRRRRGLGDTARDLAREFGVSQHTVWQIVTQRTWKTLHVGAAS